MSGKQGRHSAPTAPRPVIFLKDLPDSFGRYHDLIGASGATSSRIGDTFEATVTAHKSPGLMLFDRQVAGVEHRRDTTEIRRDGFEHFYLQVLRSGMLAGGAPGDEQALSPGDAILSDATRPQRTIVTAADYVTVILSRQLVEAVVPEAGHLHGRILPRTAWHGVGAAVLSLARRVSGFGASPAVGGDRMITGLLAEAAGGTRAQGDARDAAGGSAADRLRAELFIDANIGRPDLDIGAVAAGVGMSRSALYRAFEPVGGVEGEITRRRIACFRSAVLRPDEERSIESLALSVGFASLSHCSRVFKRTYGSAPSGFRTELRRAQATSGGGLQVGHVRKWYGELAARTSKG